MPAGETIGTEAQTAGSSRNYTKGVDMWSIGCILGEMLLGKPLFPGTSTVNQIEQVLRVIPPPSPEDVAAFHSDYRASIISRLSSQQRVTFEDILPPSTPPQALDLLKRLLVFNPEKRLTVEEALKHPYVQRFHCAAKEPALDYNVILPLDDDLQLSVAEYRNKLYEIILERKANNQRQKQHLQRKTFQPSSSQSPLPLESSCKTQGPPQPCLPSGSPVSAGAVAPCEEASHQRAAFLPAESLWPGIVARNCSVPFSSHQAPSSLNRRPESWAPADHPAPAAGTEELHGARKGPVGRRQSPFHVRVASVSGQAQEAALNHLLLRKESAPCKATAEHLNHSKEVHPIPKPSRKMFQVTANVGAAGDPRACLGSYSQSYGTICKSALQCLPLPQALAPGGQKH